MKNGTMFAARLKKFFAKNRVTPPAPLPTAPDDPIRRLATAILGIETGEDEGARAVEKLFTVFADWNDIRVSRAFELSRALGDNSPQTQGRCQQLITALSAIYRQENRPSLDKLKNIGRREARQYLEKLQGLDEYVVASVFLWSLGGHAIPVSDPVLDVLRRNELVDPSASRAEIQAFLERNISASDAKEFCVSINAYAAQRRQPSARSKSGGGRSVRSAVGDR